MKRLLKAVAVIALAAATKMAHASEGPAVRSVLAEAERVYAPRGFQNLCASRPEFCVNQRVSSEVTQVLSALSHSYGMRAITPDAPELTDERMRTLQRVNLTVNTSIQPVEDSNGDTWSFSAMYGDCEEYVLMKREVLAQLGWPRSAMRISVVRGAGDYPYHAVLVVTTRGGDFVLDNLVDDVTRVEHSPYEFVVSQSFQRPGAWVRVHNMR